MTYKFDKKEYSYEEREELLNQWEEDINMIHFRIREERKKLLALENANKGLLYNIARLRGHMTAVRNVSTHPISQDVARILNKHFPVSNERSELVGISNPKKYKKGMILSPEQVATVKTLHSNLMKEFAAATADTNKVIKEKEKLLKEYGARINKLRNIPPSVGGRKRRPRRPKGQRKSFRRKRRTTRKSKKRKRTIRKSKKRKRRTTRKSKKRKRTTRKSKKRKRRTTRKSKKRKRRTTRKSRRK